MGCEEHTQVQDATTTLKGNKTQGTKLDISRQMVNTLFQLGHQHKGMGILLHNKRQQNLYLFPHIWTVPPQQKLLRSPMTVLPQPPETWRERDRETELIYLLSESQNYFKNLPLHEVRAICDSFCGNIISSVY